MHLLHQSKFSAQVKSHAHRSQVIVELMNWDQAAPSWTEDNLSCGFWQFASHLQPLLYSYLLVAIVYHAFVALFLDTRGHYERSTRRLLPLLIVGLTLGMSLVRIISPFGFSSLPFGRPNTPGSQLMHVKRVFFFGTFIDNYKIGPFCSGSLCVKSLPIVYHDKDGLHQHSLFETIVFLKYFHCR